MRQLILKGVTWGVVLGLGAGAALAEGPQHKPPHGMFKVEVDPGTHKIFSNSGVGVFGPSDFFMTPEGYTILAQNHGTSTEPNLGIREDDGTGTTSAVRPGVDSPIVRTDDPGFRSDLPGLGTPPPTMFPDGYLLRANFYNELSFWNGSAWISPTGETLKVYDPNLTDDSGVTGDLADTAVSQVTYTANTQDRLGTINLNVTDLDNDINIHNHLFYELSRPSDNEKPTLGAYMIELGLEGHKIEAVEGPDRLGDSDPLFVIFNNGLSDSDFGAAVNAAVPEPSTAAIVTVVSIGVVALRRRRSVRR